MAGNGANVTEGSGAKKPEDPLSAPLKQLSVSDGTAEVRVVERVIHEHDAPGPALVLTRTNYVDWALVMRVQLQAQGLWTVVDTELGASATTGGRLASSCEMYRQRCCARSRSRTPPSWRGTP